MGNSNSARNPEGIFELPEPTDHHQPASGDQGLPAAKTGAAGKMLLRRYADMKFEGVVAEGGAIGAFAIHVASLHDLYGCS